MKPGEYLLAESSLELCPDRPRMRVVVRHTGDRPVQVGSHFHFFEVNRALAFDREAAYGMRLDLPAGTAVRFEPGEEKEVDLIAFGGARCVFGHNGLVEGALDDPAVRTEAGSRLAAWIGTASGNREGNG